MDEIFTERRWTLRGWTQGPWHAMFLTQTGTLFTIRRWSEPAARRYAEFYRTVLSTKHTLYSRWEPGSE